MITRAARSFWQAYEGLNVTQKRAARRAFTLFLQDPGHNSLQFKKLRGYPDYWSVRVSRDVVWSANGTVIRSSGPGSERTTNSTNSSTKIALARVCRSSIRHLFQLFRPVRKGRVRCGEHLNRLRARA